MLLTIWAVEVARMFARRAAKAKNATYPLPENPPAVAIILPIKGIEEDTAENLRALLKLSYPNLRYFFSVESEGDPVIPLLRKLTVTLPADKFEIVIAGMATKRGQKIHNQLAAVARTTAADEILLFMDADARRMTAGFRRWCRPGFAEHRGQHGILALCSGVESIFGPSGLGDGFGDQRDDRGSPGAALA